MELMEAPTGGQPFDKEVADSAVACCKPTPHGGCASLPDHPVDLSIPMSETTKQSFCCPEGASGLSPCDIIMKLPESGMAEKVWHGGACTQVKVEGECA
jgi:hypothetical protein